MRRSPNSSMLRRGRCTCNGCRTPAPAGRRRTSCGAAGCCRNPPPDVQTCSGVSSVRHLSGYRARQCGRFLRRGVIFVQGRAQRIGITVPPYVNALDFTCCQLHFDSCSRTHNTLYFSCLSLTNIISLFGTRKLISNLIQRYSGIYYSNPE